MSREPEKVNSFDCFNLYFNSSELVNKNSDGLVDCLLWFLVVISTIWHLHKRWLFANEVGRKFGQIIVWGDLEFGGEFLMGDFNLL